MKKIVIILLVSFWASIAVASTQEIQVIEIIFSTWENKFSANQKLTKESNKRINVIPQSEIVYQEKRILKLKKDDPENGDRLLERLQRFEKENVEWAKKKENNNEPARPFPQAKMKNKTLEKEMKDLLTNRGIKVKNLVITDTDWWVQHGEFRYIGAAAMSRDGKGQYWFNISFRQIKTLSGYAPTEIWDFKDSRIRLP